MSKFMLFSCRMLFNTYTCSICQHGYTTPYDLVRHMRLLHVVQDVPVVERALDVPGDPGALGALGASKATGASNAIGMSIYDTGLRWSPSLSQDSLVFQHLFTMMLSGPTGSEKLYSS